jgi:hypothetical protein
MNNEKKVFLLVTRQFERILFFYFRLQKIKINVNKASLPSSPLFPERGKNFRGEARGKLISAPSGTDWQHNIPVEFVGLYWTLHINLQLI